MDRPRGVPLQKQETDLPNATTGMRRADILAAFKLFDKDNSGTIDKEELYNILTYKGSGRSIGLGDNMAREIIQEFDTNGDGELDINEFALLRSLPLLIM